MSLTGAVSRKVRRRPFWTQKLLGPASDPAPTESALDCHVPLANRLDVWRASAVPSTVIVFKISRTNPGSGLKPGRSTDSWADSTHPLTGVPRSTIVSPSMVTGPATDAENASPARTREMGSELSKRTVMSVPAGRLRVFECDAARKGVPLPALRSAGTAGCALSSVA